MSATDIIQRFATRCLLCRSERIPNNQRDNYSSSASIMLFPISSISNSFNAAKGRFIANNSRIGSSLPSMRTTKLPLPGFSLLTSTRALEPLAAKYFCILPARVLNTILKIYMELEICVCVGNLRKTHHTRRLLLILDHPAPQDICEFLLF